MFSGSYVALVTPFSKKGDDVDLQSLNRLVAWQIDQGTEGILAAGSTGEGFSLTQKEHAQVIETVVEASQKRVPVLAGTSALTTKEAIILAQQAENAGADGLLSVAPPYLKPTQKGLYEHFKVLKAATSLPLVLYNNPSRAGSLITEDTLAKLARIPGIVGVKDSADCLARPLAVRHHLPPALAKDFCQLSGDDGTVPAFLAQGGQGSISAIANLVPSFCAKLHQLWREGQISQVIALQQKLYPLIKHVFAETSVACLKAGLQEKGLCYDSVRSPLQPLSSMGRQMLKSLKASLEDISGKEPKNVKS